jgi:hypothetical protein
MDDAPFLGLVVLIVVVFAAIGVCTALMDFRYFGHLEQQCKTQGYIQNETVRINCQVEEKNK